MPSAPPEAPAITKDQPSAATHLQARWHVLWTRSHCEQLVRAQLTGKGYHLFLPTMDIWTRRRGLREHARIPMFPGYLFLHRAIDKTSYLEVGKTVGLVKLLGKRWDQLDTVPEAQIQALQKVHQARLPALVHPYLRDGERVRITGGLLRDAVGILLRQNPNKGLLVVSIDLLRRSVAVEVDCTLVAPA